MGTIVVGTDGSEAARAAAAEGIDLARRLGAGVIFVSVSPPPPDYLGKPFWQEHVTESLGRARRALDDVRKLAEQAGIEADYEVLEGDPAKELARFAEARDADLIAVGTSGLGLADVLLGSVAAGLIRRASRPVVVVREPRERARPEPLDVQQPVVQQPVEAGPAPA